MKVRLRAMEPEDLDFLYQIENNTKLWNVGVTNVPYSRYALHHFMESSTGDIYADKQVRLMIDDEDGHVVGITDLTDFDPRYLRAEVGIVIANAYRRQGYAKAALSELINYARNVLHLRQLYAIVSAENTVSVSLFCRLGFIKGAELKNWFTVADHPCDAVVMQLFL